MDSPYHGKVSVDAALEGIRLCLQNAESLVREAQILREHGAHARAIALAVIALEEMGKLPKLTNFGRYQRQDKWPAFWKSYRSHIDKLDLNATAMALSLSDDDAEILSWLGRRSTLSSLHELKIKALYVDWQEESFDAPNNIPDIEEVARQVIHVATDSIQFHMERGGRLTREGLLRIQDRTAAIEESRKDAEGPEDLLRAFDAERGKST